MAPGKRAKRRTSDGVSPQIPKSPKLARNQSPARRATPPHRMFSPLATTPSAVTSNKDFPGFSSENTLSMHTTVKFGSRALSQLRSATSVRDRVDPTDDGLSLQERLEPESVEEDTFDDEPSSKPARFALSKRPAGDRRRTSLSSFDLQDPLKDDHGLASSDVLESRIRGELPGIPLTRGPGTQGHTTPSPKRSPKRRLSAGGAVGETSLDVSLGLSVSIAYASFIFCRTFFSVTQAAMKADPSIKLTDVQANNIITSFGVAFGLAKFPAGIIVNFAPPEAALLAFMAGTALMVTLFSRAHGYNAMFMIALLNAVPQAGAYPAVTKLVCAGFAPEHHSSVFALVSIGSRVGQVAVSLVLGEVLRRTGDWRTTQQVAPVVILSAALLVILLTHGSRSHHSGGSGAAGLGAKSRETSSAEEVVVDPLFVRLQRLAQNPRFWLVNFSASMLLVSKGFDTYAVRFIADMCDAAHPSECRTPRFPNDTGAPELGANETLANFAGGMSSGNLTCLCKSYAPQVTAGVSMGIVTSLLFGSYVYERLRGRGRWLRALFIVSLCALNFAVAGLLYLDAESVLGSSPREMGATSHPRTSNGVVEGSFRMVFGAEWEQGQTLCTIGALLYLLGFSAGYPFYVPQSLFAVEFGAADAATVVGCGECLQSVFAAAFILTGQRYAVVDDVTDWVKICSFISGAAAIGFVLMLLFMYESMRAADKRRSKADKAS